MNLPSKTNVQELYSINELYRSRNELFPIGMQLIKSEQEKDDRLQQLLEGPKKSHFGTKIFHDVEVITPKDRVCVPPSL